MNERLLELAVRRGELKARCAQQREALAATMRPVVDALGMADQAVLGAGKLKAWLSGHPTWVAGGLAALLAIRPRRAWRWGKRAFFLWRGWLAVRSRLSGLL